MNFSPLGIDEHTGNASTKATPINNLLVIDSSSLKQFGEINPRLGHVGACQGIADGVIISTNEGFRELKSMLVFVGESAQMVREFEKVNAVARVMLRLPPSTKTETAAYYYRALSLNQRGRGKVLLASSLFEQVSEGASSHYRAKAMLALGTNSVAVGDHKTATDFYREVMQILDRDRVFDPMTLYTAARMTAVMKSLEGDHRSALADLEKMLPLVRRASVQQPYAYYDYLNTLAVELTEAGRLEEAKNATRIALSSPFAHAYPEWRDTLDDIEHRELRASRSTIAVSKRDHTETNLATLPRRPRETAMTPPEGQSQPVARIIKFPIRSPSSSELNQRSEELEPFDKRRIVSEKLYEMFLSAIDDAPLNRELVEELYKTFLRKRKRN